MSLALVGKYHNVRAPGEPGVRYVKHLYCGGGIVVLVFELPGQMMKMQGSDDHHSWVLH